MNQREIDVDEAQVGRILHFVLENGWGLVCRPAIVVEDWPTQGKPGYVNLQVFTDGGNDGAYAKDWHEHKLLGDNVSISAGSASPANRMAIVWETSVLPNHAVRAHRTWHWPRECASMHAPAPAFIKDSQKYYHNHVEGFVDEHNCLACKLFAEANAAG